MKSAALNGVGIVKNHAAVIEMHEEEKIWNSEALGDDSPVKLLKALFYLNGLHFAIRGGVEHRNLTMDQFKLDENRSKIHFHEGTTKNYQGGLNNRKILPTTKEHVCICD